MTAPTNDSAPSTDELATILADDFRTLDQHHQLRYLAVAAARLRELEALVASQQDLINRAYVYALDHCVDRAWGVSIPPLTKEGERKFGMDLALAYKPAAEPTGASLPQDKLLRRGASLPNGGAS